MEHYLLGELAKGLELNLENPPRMLPTPLLKEVYRITELELLNSLTDESITDALL